MEIHYKGLLIKMKKIILILAAILFFLLVSNYGLALANTWKIGDKAVVIFMCKKEKAIMDIAYADTKSQEKLILTIYKNIINSNCLEIRPPQIFLITDIIGSYKDYNNRNTTILKIKSPVYPSFKGYTIATGVEGKGI
jgi:hypothetical protein